MPPKVSVLMITYNHEAFIAQAVESALAQQTNFDFEIVIGEDCSTDHTRAILEKLQAENPERMRLLPSERNLGAHQNFALTLKACYGEYVALLEGDDYWTSGEKLQIQVDYLDQRRQSSACFHNAMEIYSDLQGEARVSCQNLEKDIFCFDDLLITNFVPTCSVLFRRSLFKSQPEWFSSLGMGDWPLLILLSLQGSIGYLDRVMCVHRVHSGGVWSGNQIFSNRKAVIKLFGVLYVQLDCPYQPLILHRLEELFDHTGAILVMEGISEQRPIEEMIKKAENILTDELLVLVDSVPSQRKLKSSFYAGMSYACYQRKEMHWARYCLLRSIRYDKTRLRDRGLWSLGMETLAGDRNANRIRLAMRKFR